mmetsp:Transcript_38778/g.95860  ORF Transcript_38778/g.95860 Transcript_38778/m.95860 type:complete len:983 (+) Transcript_38778:493-3441(+)
MRRARSPRSRRCINDCGARTSDPVVFLAHSDPAPSPHLACGGAGPPPPPPPPPAEEAAVAGTSGRAAGVSGTRQFAALRRPPVRLAPSARAERKDKLSAADVAKVHAFFYANGAVSPCTRDRVRRRVGPNLWQVAQALVAMQTMDALFSQFQTENVLCGTALSYSSFKKLAPWNLRRVKRETCLCRTCELYKCYHDAMDTVPAIFSLPDATPAASPAAEAPAAANASPAVGAPAAAPASPAADAPAASLGSACSNYTSKVSSLLEFCRLKSKREQADYLVCGGCVAEAAEACVNNTCSSCGFGALWSSPDDGLRVHIVDSDGHMRADAAPEWSTQIKWDTYTSTSSESPAAPWDGDGDADPTPSGDKEPMRQQRTATLVDFFDEFEQLPARKFVEHRRILSELKRGSQQLHELLAPGWLILDVDWSENCTLVGQREIQSEYWTTKQFSLFIAIMRFLCTAAWVDRSGLIKVGEEVIVEPEWDSVAGSTTIPKGAYFAKVFSAAAALGEGGIYTVEKPNGERVEVQRHLLRHRSIKTIAYGCITNDKHHDGAASQHFINKVIVDVHAAYDSTEHFHTIGVHSDNATHFKSTRMLFWWSHTRNIFEWLRMVLVRFGAPGHGKGVWDGLGAVLKRCVLSAITNGKALTESGKITTDLEAREHLAKHFMSEAWTKSHESKVVSEIKIVHSPRETIETERQRGAASKFSGADGISGTYEYLALTYKLIAARTFGCWCECCWDCVCAGGMGSTCPSPAVGCGRPMCEWVVQELHQIDARTVQKTRTTAQAAGKGFAKKLRPGDWVVAQACKGRRGRGAGDRYWIGQGADAGDGSCIIKEFTHGGGKLEQTTFTKGDTALAVKWFDRHAADPEGMHFVEWDSVAAGNDPDACFVLNATRGARGQREAQRGPARWSAACRQSGAPVGRAAARARGADDLGAPPQSSRRDPRHSVVMDAAGEHLARGASSVTHVDLSSAVLSHVILTLFHM